MLANPEFLNNLNKFLFFISSLGSIFVNTKLLALQNEIS